jgi:Protein of unknown function (DUF4238)
MPLDHYVSQVHLRNFYSPALGGQQMYGFRKRDGHVFPCSSKDVCRIDNGSTNAYLLEDRAIEEFLTTIEPRYNQAVNQLKSGRIDREAVYVVAGFLAYVSACSPTAMRLGADPLRNVVEATAAILDSTGQLLPAPEALGGKTMSQLISEGVVKVDVDPKYPQAIGISTILDLVGTWGNSVWDLIHNTDSDSPFFSSDFPAAIERSANGQILARLVPLTPDFSVRIHPDRGRNKRQDMTFSAFRPRVLAAKPSDVRAINESIARCAEELVFFRDHRDWVVPFLTKNARFRIEATTNKVPFREGTMNISSMAIAHT